MARRPSKPKVERKIDLFVILEALDLGDMSVYDDIAADPGALAEFRREIGYMLPIWMTGSARDLDHKKLVERFNAICNQRWFDLAKHPRLQAKLLAAVGLGTKTPHRFHKVKAASKNSAMLELLELQHPDIREHEVRLWARKNTWEQTQELAQMYGWQDDQIDDLKKNYKEVTNQWF